MWGGGIAGTAETAACRGADVSQSVRAESKQKIAGYLFFLNRISDIIKLPSQRLA